MSIESITGDKERIVFLDYLRIFAFSSVLVAHQLDNQIASVASDPDVHITLRHLATAIQSLSWGGGAGITVFFLVSGYIIAHVLRSEKTGAFVVKRIFRIYPLYVTALLLEILHGIYTAGTQLPPLSVWLPRLLLIGDFFGTPYALKNVEWTLRIEIVFYAFMALCRSTIFPRRAEWMPAIFVLVTVLLQIAGPFPDFIGWSTGYTTIYLPILFIGSNIYLMEKGLAKKSHCLGSILWILATYFITLPHINRAGIGSNFLVYALGLFSLAWAFRRLLPDAPVVRLLSNLTYAVYLMHHWIWDYLGGRIDAIGLTLVSRDVQIIVLLLSICTVLHYTVERYGVRLGARLLRISASKQRTSIQESILSPK